MPRATRLERGRIIIPKDMDKASWKIIITDSNGTAHDVTNDLSGEWSLIRVATEGLSNFIVGVDNTEGKYKDKFSEKNTVDFYYNFLEKSALTTVRCRGYIDNVFDGFNISDGSFLIIEGRDALISSTYEHFADTHITIQFTARNNLDCWLGTSGTADAEGNYPDGVLYNSGLILRVYDTSDNTWKTYKDLSGTQRDTLKGQTGYTKTHTQTYVDKSRLTISKPLANQGDYEFRIWYDSSGDKSYLMVHPEEAIINTSENIVAGQNLLDLGRYGKDTTTEFNRIKEKGFTEGSLLTMKTKEDTDRQAAMWIKDKEETNQALTTNEELIAKADARLNELKEAPDTGGLECCALPSLQPAEKARLNIPYIINEDIIIKSFTVTGGTDLIFTLELKERETSFERIFKDRIDENVNVSPTNNPNGMRNAIVYDFSDTSDYTLTDCEITEGILSLSSGKVSGVCLIELPVADNNVNHVELRIKANQMWNCTYRISNDRGVTFETLTVGTLHAFISTGRYVQLEITLKEATGSTSPEFDKVNILSK